MCQNRNKFESEIWWEPGISLISALLELFYYIAGARHLPALKLDRHHLRHDLGLAFFTDIQIIAPLLIIGDFQALAVHINNDAI